MGMKLEKMEMHTCKRSRKKPRQINVWFTLLLACHRKKSKVKVGDDWVEFMNSAQRCFDGFLSGRSILIEMVDYGETSRPGK